MKIGLLRTRSTPAWQCLRTLSFPFLMGLLVGAPLAGAMVFDPPGAPVRPGGFYTVLEDFNGDGFPDLVGAVAGSTDKVSFLPGDGAGGFGTEWLGAVGEDPFAVVSADFDEDGELDLAVANRVDLSILLGNGDGTFGAEARFALGADIARFPAVGDFNNDLHVDIAVAVRNPYVVAVLLGNGDGTFDPVVHLPAIARPRVVVVEDLDENGTQDLAVISESYGEFAVFLGNGDGTFQPGAFATVAGAGATDMIGADLNGDGHVDLAYGDTFLDSVHILTGAGDGTFGAPEAIVLGENIFGLALGDFDGDGNADLAAARVLGFSFGDAVHLLTGSGSGTFVLQESMAFTPYIEHALAGDLNGDDFDDLILSPGGTILLSSATPAGTCSDADGDGYGVLGDIACPGGGAVDCADGDATRSPGTLEICDGIDNDCDLAVDDGFDLDGDGITTCAGDCDDGDPGAFPGASDVCNLADDDCNGTVDDEPGASASCADDGFLCSVEACAPTVACSTDALTCVGRSDLASAYPGQVIDGLVRPWDVTEADLDEDGNVDLVVAVIGSEEVAVFFGDGNGGLQRPIRIPLPEFPVHIAVADLNNDQNEDLVVRARSVWTILGNGDGTFQTPAAFAAGEGSGQIVVGNFNADLIPDVATVNTQHWDVSLLPGNGDGTLGVHLRAPVGRNPVGLAADDLDDNGTLDLVVTDGVDDAISVLPGLGDGTFGPRIPVAVGDGPIALVVGHFDGNTNLDLAVANRGSDDVSILLGNGDLTFGPETRIATAILPRDITAAHLDGDSHIDLAVATRADVVSVLLGDGAGGFVPGAQPATGKDPWAVVAADMDEDGSQDLVTADFSADGLTILPGAGDGTFPPRWESIATGNSPLDVAVGDFNGDGLPDLAAPGSSATDVAVLLGIGGGNFGPPAAVPASAFPGTVATADFNDDGALDLLLGSGFSVHVLPGVGDGTFLAAVSLGVGDEVFRVATGDVNLDGRIDVAVPHFAAGTFSMLLGNGDGTFQVIGPVAAEPNARGMAIGDVNGDFFPDVVLTHERSQLPNISIHLGNGDGTFQAPVFEDAGDSPSSVALRDLNADLVPDLVTTSNDSIVVLLGNGDGTFAGVTYPAAAGATEARVGDLNVDGLPDVLATLGGGGVAALSGAGDGTLTGVGRFVTGGTVSNGLVVADLDLDGRLDLVTADGSASLRRALNRGPASVCLDGDGDGYGRPGNPLCPGGPQPDCDDARATVFPGNPEFCDLLDNDCDVMIDESVNPDLDGDGFGACRDCNDADDEVYPGAVEVNDGQDNQCAGDPGFGLVDELEGGVTLGDAGLTWTEQPGATRYQVLRSTTADLSAGCVTFTMGGPPFDDGDSPAMGAVLHYVVRPWKPSAGSFGADSAGVERTPVCLP